MASSEDAAVPATAETVSVGQEATRGVFVVATRSKSINHKSCFPRTRFKVQRLQIDRQRGLLTKSLGHHFPEFGVGRGRRRSRRHLRILRADFG